MTPSPEHSSAARGVLYAGGAYFLWGLFPLFWKQLAAVDATELIAHRIVWSLVFVASLTAFTTGWAELRGALASPRLVGLHLMSGVLVSVNWLCYVWGVNHGRIVEASLGYFLVPLCNVGLGRLFLGERLRPLQRVAISVAMVGVGLQFMRLDHLPWVALTVACTFAAYGLLRKQSPLGSLAGLTLETGLLLPVGAGFLLWRGYAGTGALGQVGPWQHVLVLSTGVLTAVPLLLFAAGARRIRLGTLGLLQYGTPSMTFALGVFLYHEPVTRLKLASFALIWTALALYTADNLRALRGGRSSVSAGS
jgi:chloramphenicol-sensitive protein RarD